MNRLFDLMLKAVIRRGQLRVTWPDGRSTTYGQLPGRSAALTLRTPRAARDLLLNPELNLGELYVAEEVAFDGPGELIEFLCLIDDNDEPFRTFPPIKLLKRLRRLTRGLRDGKTFSRARKNVAHHYDIDERLYRLFLDSDLQYSCAYFTRPDADIEEAQADKKRHIAAKLRLAPNLRVLDIGCGWGGLALSLTRLAGVDVTGVTLSVEQHRVAEERARAGGLADRARFAVKDYRAVEGEFDRIVSVGMFEHVGADNYGEFFRHARRLLAPKGVMLLHTIGRSGLPGVTSPWIDKYIFPGSYVPSLSEIMSAVESSGLIVTDIEILRLHYADTLRLWRQRFDENRASAEKLFDARFCRMWDFYLASAEAAFRSGYLVVFQIQLVGDQTALPLTRDYMLDEERRLRAPPKRERDSQVVALR